MDLVWDFRPCGIPQGHGLLNRGANGLTMLLGKILHLVA